MSRLGVLCYILFWSPLIVAIGLKNAMFPERDEDMDDE
jgi:hypothetical protein